MFDPEFNPYDLIERLQEQINQILVDQQQLAKNCHYLYTTLVQHQKQLQTLTNLDNLFNQKLDLIRTDLTQRIDAITAQASAESINKQ
jgi:hypothetical protein